MNKAMKAVLFSIIVLLVAGSTTKTDFNCKLKADTKNICFFVGV